MGVHLHCVVSVEYEVDKHYTEYLKRPTTQEECKLVSEGLSKIGNFHTVWVPLMANILSCKHQSNQGQTFTTTLKLPLYRHLGTGQIQAKEVAVNVGTTTKSVSSHLPSHSVHSGTMFDCGCKLANGKPCIETLDNEAVQAMKCDTNGLSHDELDMVILGHLAASHRAAVNKTTFHFNGQCIYHSMSLYLHNISCARLTALVTHYSTKGLTPRTHGNTKQLLHNATSYDTIKEIVRFILNLAEEQALVLPGRVPGYHRSDLQLLPSSASKSAIWFKYCEFCSDNRKAVSRKTFCSLWQELVPHVIIMKPMTDLFWECQNPLQPGTIFSLHHGNVHFLGYAVSPFQGR